MAFVEYPAPRAKSTVIQAKIRRRTTKYSPLTNAYAKFLFGTGESAVWLIDRIDWGRYDNRQQGIRFFTMSQRLEMYRRGELSLPPLKLTRSHIQSHLEPLRRDRFYFTSNRRSPRMLLMVDIDAHDGQHDGPTTARYVRDLFFPGAYMEPSRRGWHIYVLMEVGKMPRADANLIVADAEADLSAEIAAIGFQSTVEIKGTFTLWDGQSIRQRGKLAALPVLANGMDDFQKLANAPVFSIEFLRKLKLDRVSIPHPDPMRTLSASHAARRIDPSNAWERMQQACWDFTGIFNRLPNDASEMVEFYAQQYTAVATIDKDTYRRAKDAIEQRARTFDPLKAGEAGYENQREKLLEAVQTHCIDRENRYSVRATDEDLAVCLYAVTKTSFGVSNERHQWTCPLASIEGMFKALEPVTGRTCANTKKPNVLLSILERAGLVECVTRTWLHAGKGRGIGRRWVIGHNHWRRSEFDQFAKGLNYCDLIKSN